MHSAVILPRDAYISAAYRAVSVRHVRALCQNG